MQSFLSKDEQRPITTHFLVPEVYFGLEQFFARKIEKPQGGIHVDSDLSLLTMGKECAPRFRRRSLRGKIAWWAKLALAKRAIKGLQAFLLRP